MSYLPMGDVSSENFNSTKYPGTCKPSNVTTLATFKRMQMQLNRCASVSGLKTIAIDGDIGPGTLGLFGSLKSKLGTYASGSFATYGSAATKIAGASASSCVAVSSISDVIGNVAEGLANSLKAPERPPAPTPIKAPVLVMPNGEERPAPAGAGLLAAWTGMSTPMKVAAVGIFGGIGYFAYKEVSKGKRRR